MTEYSLYHSPYIVKNLNYLISDLKYGVDLYKSINSISRDNITWDYQWYNIFNLCTYKKSTQHLKKIILNYVKCFLDEHEFKYDEGIVFFSWINYHSNEEEMLKLHGHNTDFHGYVCIDPLDTTTVFVEPVKNQQTFEIKNEVGLIYIGSNSQNTFHYVKLNSPQIRPRITLAFNFEPINLISNSNSHVRPNPSTEIIFL